ncbi:MAG: acylphosphatase [Rhodospirillales bacterium]|nr:acylphosphatase [Rhodospirillales bacterium]
MNARRLLIGGLVQGVGFREWMVTRARALGLDGWVRNLPDGSVEALICGPEAAIEEMLRACRRGPAAASVERILEEWAEAPENRGFFRR